MSQLGDKLLNVIDQAILGKRPTPAAEVQPFVPLSIKVLELSGADLVTKAQKDLLRKCTADYAAGQQTVRTYNYTTAHRAWLEHRETLAKSVPSGGIDSLDAYGESEFESEHLAKMEAGKAACRAACRACIPVAREIAEEFAPIADKFAAEQEAAEIAAYARFGLKYPGPSPLIVSLKTVGKWALALVPAGVAAAGTGNNPRDMLPYLTF